MFAGWTTRTRRAAPKDGDGAPPELPVEGTPQAQTGTYPLVGTVQDFPGSHAAAPPAAVAGDAGLNR